MNYYIEINGKPKCEYDYVGGYVALPTCSHPTLEEANIAKDKIEILLRNVYVKVIEGICPAYLEYCGNSRDPKDYEASDI